MVVCDSCIQAIKSRGEKLWVGEAVQAEEEQIICDFCDEEFDELFKVKLD